MKVRTRVPANLFGSVTHHYSVTATRRRGAAGEQERVTRRRSRFHGPTHVTHVTGNTQRLLVAGGGGGRWDVSWLWGGAMVGRRTEARHSVTHKHRDGDTPRRQAAERVVLLARLLQLVAVILKPDLHLRTKTYDYSNAVS